MSLIINALVLRVTPFKERSVILSLLCQEEGLLSAIVSTSKKDPKQWLEPFTLVRGKTKERKGDLYQLQELEGTKWFLGIREKPAAIQALRSMAKALHQAIIEEYPVPLLYTLFLKILEGLDEGKDPDSLEALFHVKLALHEGSLPRDGWSEAAGNWITQAEKIRSFKQLPQIPSKVVLEEIRQKAVG